MDGGEAFFLAAAVGVKARQLFVAQRASSANDNESALLVANGKGGERSSLWTGEAIVEVPLILAVACGAWLRRFGNFGRGTLVSMKGGIVRDDVRSRSNVHARVASLEMGMDRVDEEQKRTAREVSRLRTRVRMTRRELSPMVRRAGETSAKFGEVALDLAAKIEEGEKAGEKLIESMDALHAVSAKQFDVLSKSVRELRAAMAELENTTTSASSSTTDKTKTRVEEDDFQSLYAKKEEVYKLEETLNAALKEMEDCLAMMVRDKEQALLREDRFSKLDQETLVRDQRKDALEENNKKEEENKEEEEEEEEPVWVGEKGQVSIKKSNPEIKLYRFDEPQEDDV